MARCIPTQLRVVDPNNPRMVVNIGTESRWLDGPIEGAWWHRVLPWLAAALAITVICFLIWRPTRTVTTTIAVPVASAAPSPAPVASPAPAPKTKAAPTPPMPSRLVIDLAPVERGLNRVADQMAVSSKSTSTKTAEDKDGKEGSSSKPLSDEERAKRFWEQYLRSPIG